MHLHSQVFPVMFLLLFSVLMFLLVQYILPVASRQSSHKFDKIREKKNLNQKKSE